MRRQAESLCPETCQQAFWGDNLKSNMGKEFLTTGKRQKTILSEGIFPLSSESVLRGEEGIPMRLLNNRICDECSPEYFLVFFYKFLHEIFLFIIVIFF